MIFLKTRKEKRDSLIFFEQGFNSALKIEKLLLIAIKINE